MAALPVPGRRRCGRADGRDQRRPTGCCGAWSGRSSAASTGSCRAPTARSSTGPGIDFADLRTYTPEDDVRHIDWNVTARLDEPYVRQYTEDRELTAWLVLDRSASMEFGAAGAGQGRRAHRARRLPGPAARPRRQPGRRDPLRQAARAGDAAPHRPHPRAAAGPRAGQAPAGAPRRRGRRPTSPRCCALALSTIRRRTLVFVISDFITATGWERPLARLAHRHEVVAVRLVDPLELELPDLGLVLVEDAETGEQVLADTSDPVFRRRFHAEVDAREQALQGVDPPRRGAAQRHHHRRRPGRRAGRDGRAESRRARAERIDDVRLAVPARRPRGRPAARRGLRRAAAPARSRRRRAGGVRAGRDRRRSRRVGRRRHVPFGCCSPRWPC